MSPLFEALAEATLIGVHVLGGGIWVGVMVFSIFVLHPRAEQYFSRDADFEDFIFTVVHGARWKVFSGIVAILASGIGLAVWPGHALAMEPLWLGLFALKLFLELGISQATFALLLLQLFKIQVQNLVHLGCPLF